MSRLTVVDAHCHLASSDYADIDGLVRRARRNGALGIVASGTSLESSRRVLELSRTYKRFVFPTVGIHPERADLTEQEVEDVKSLIHRSSEEIVAIGEVGIPYYSIRRKPSAPLIMSSAAKTLAEFSALARSKDLALVVHAPHTAASYALSAVRGARVRRALFHWHKASADITEAIISAGYHVSVTPEVCYEERDQKLVRSIPLSNLVVETDGPWRYGGEFAGSKTEPTVLRHVVTKVASLRSEPVEEVAEKLVDNASRLFGLKL